jgi:hypothetical protein
VGYWKNLGACGLSGIDWGKHGLAWIILDLFCLLSICWDSHELTRIQLGLTWHHLESVGFMWTHFCSIRLNRTHVHSPASACTQLDSFRFIRFNLDICGFTWVYLCPTGSTCARLGPLVLMWPLSILVCDRLMDGHLLCIYIYILVYVYIYTDKDENQSISDECAKLFLRICPSRRPDRARHKKQIGRQIDTKQQQQQ